MDDMYMPCLHDLNSLQIVFLYEVGDCSIYVFFGVYMSCLYAKL